MVPPPANGVSFFSEPSFWLPLQVENSAWTTHGPFGFWLVAALRPGRIVELGTHRGYSYFVFCQAVRALGLSCRCFAVDHWQGDDHAGRYNANVFALVDRHNRRNYADFSNLVRSSFAEAVDLFEDGSIDLLHIDGQHYYEDVRADFETWRPKLSERAVVLFHDITEHGRGFGVHRLWDEVIETYPGFAFVHGHGLGVLGVGKEQAAPLAALFALDRDPAARDLVRAGYARLGQAVGDRRAILANDAVLAERKSVDAEFARLQASNKALEAVVAKLLSQEGEGRTAAAAVDRLGAVEASLGKLAKRLTKASAKLRGSRDGRSGVRRHRKKKSGRRSRPTPSPLAPAPAALPGEPLAAAAIAAVWTNGWAAALPLWQDYVDSGLPVHPTFFVSSGQPEPQNGGFRTVVPRAPVAGDVRWCVYTALFGAYDALRAPLIRPPGIDFICFTDTDIEVDGWRVVRLPPAVDPVRESRRYKVLCHRYLEDYDASLYVDASTVFAGDIGRFVRRWCLGRPFAMWSHPQRNDVYDEAIAVLVQRKADPRRVVDQIVAYEAAGLPRATGLVEASFMWRDHRDHDVISFMEAWDEEIGAHSRRDQISLGFLMWRLGIRPEVFPAHLGNARKNFVSSLSMHLGAAGEKQTERGRRRVAGSRPRLVFLYEPAYRGSGSTTLRIFQLADIVRSHLGDRWEVAVTDDADIRDAVVVVGKGRMATVSEPALEKLRQANVAVIADFVDAPLRSGLLPFIDLLWASSIGGYRSALAIRPGMPVDLVTHHADVRLPRREPAEAYSVGYFGEPINAVATPEILAEIDMVPVSTRSDDGGWLQRIGGYALHYAVRPPLKDGGHKPFTKGFVAARCGANVLIDRTDGDAIHYLGDDYPFLIDNSRPASILAGLELARQSFASEIWRAGLEVMRQVEALSTPEHVAREVAVSLRRFA
ncbi:MAG: class I SAM-dependent methyltransferase [Bauldia sp.]|nr:class I SAM-dependent methyltransferase [Bauldia sp.]